MAVQTTATEATFVGTGVLSIYSPQFYVNTADQVEVYVEGTLQTFGDDYTLLGVGDADGVDVQAVFGGGTKVYIRRNTAITQDVDTQNNEVILEEVFDAGLDKLTMIAQEQETKIDDITLRALRVPLGEAVPDIAGATSRANKFLAFDSAGNPIVSQGTGADAGLRVDLAAAGGAARVGAAGGGTVQGAIDNFDKRNLALAAGLVTSSCSIFMLADSIGEAAGASVYTNGYSCILMRSIEAMNDRGYDNNAGFGHHTIVNMANAVSESGAALGGGGSYVAAGITGSRISLTAGGYVQLTGRQIAYLDAIYDASASTGSILIKVNGTTVDTNPVGGVGLQSTFPSLLRNGYNIQPDDTVRIEASGGTIQLAGILALRAISNVPLAYVAAKSGSAYQDYTSAAAMDEIAFFMNLLRAGSPKIMLHALGTNNLYNAGKSLSPSAMVATIATLIAGINARCTNVLHVIQVPPKANEGIFPIIASGFTYADYVTAITVFAATNRYGLIRQDLSPITNDTGLLADGVHPTDSGHLVMAVIAARSLDVDVQPYARSLGPQYLRASKVFDPPSVASGASTLTGLVCVGAALGDFVEVSFSLDTQGVFLTGWVQAADTLNIRFNNLTGGAIDLASGTLRAVVRKA